MNCSKIVSIFFFLVGWMTNAQVSLSTRAQSEKPLVVVVCSYNNEKWSENTINSIFTQDYHNFRVIIVDDGSTDNNVEVIQNYIDKHNLSNRVTFIRNEKRRRKLFNLYRVLYDCLDNEIVFMVDGDDSIAHSQVFSQINSLYNDDNIWFTYGQYRNVPASQAIQWGHKEMGYCRVVPKHIQRKQEYRKYSFIYMHPRTFRAWLFKLVKLEDLIADNINGFQGDFYPASNDVAMYFPMVEMAHTRIKFIPDILYIRNLYSEIVGFKVDRSLQTSSAREIRKKIPYSVLFQPKINRLANVPQASADVFLLCRNNLNNIESVLTNIETQSTHRGVVYLFYNGTADNKKICRFIKKKFPSVIFVPCDSQGSKGLKSRLLEHLSVVRNEHIFVTTDACSLVQHVNFSDYIFWLEKTFAYRFYLNRHAGRQGTPKFIALTDTVCAWKMAAGIDKWRSVVVGEDSFVSRKSTLYQEIKRLEFSSMYGFFKEMNSLATLPARVGLFSSHEIVRGSQQFAV